MHTLPDTLTAFWYVQPNDMVGGWCVCNTDTPPSKHDPLYNETIVADMLDEASATHIANLHNQWVVAQQNRQDKCGECGHQIGAHKDFDACVVCSIVNETDCGWRVRLDAHNNLEFFKPVPTQVDPAETLEPIDITDEDIAAEDMDEQTVLPEELPAGVFPNCKHCGHGIQWKDGKWSHIASTAWLCNDGMHGAQPTIAGFEGNADA